MLVALVLVTALAVSSPSEEVKNTVEALKKAAGNKPQERALILERMDLAEMGKRSLGRHWRNISDKERAEYLDVFAEYIEVFYRERVFNSTGFIGTVEIKYLKEKIDGEFAEVETLIIAGSDRFSVVYKLHFVGGHWKAYDFIIENVSIVSSLRSQFDRIVSRESFAELLRKLRERIRELDK